MIDGHIMNSNKLIIPLHDVQSCYNFSVALCETMNQRETDFGRKDMRRTLLDQKVDTTEGKIAECGLKERLLQESLKIGLDFEIYEGKNNTDGCQDIKFIMVDGESTSTSLKVDVKATKAYSKWILIEKNKMIPDVFVMMCVDFPRDAEKNEILFREAISKQVSVRAVGIAYKSDFFGSDSAPFFAFRQGESLFRPDILKDLEPLRHKNIKKWREEVEKMKTCGKLSPMAVTMKCEMNYGLPMFMLRNGDNDWKELSNKIKNNIVKTKKMELMDWFKDEGFL